MTKHFTLCMAILCIIVLANWGSKQTQDNVIFEGILKTQMGNVENVDHITFNDNKKTKQIPVFEAKQPGQQIQTPLTPTTTTPSAGLPTATTQPATAPATETTIQIPDATQPNIHIEQKQTQVNQPQPEQAQATVTCSTTQTDTKNKDGDIMLTIDPKNVTTYFDLNEIQEIHVLRPQQKYVYQKNDQSHKEEYIMVEISSKGAPERKKRYLINYNLEIHCNAIEGDQAGLEKKALLRGIDSLKITGYYFKPEESQACEKECALKQKNTRESKKGINKCENLKIINNTKI